MRAVGTRSGSLVWAERSCTPWTRASPGSRATQPIRKRVRRAPLHRFPYGVFYVIRDDRIDALAVYHVRRRPRAFES
jgi:hypothetical protein